MLSYGALVDRLYRSQAATASIHRLLVSLCERALREVEEHGGVPDVRARFEGLRSLAGDDPEDVANRARELLAVASAKFETEQLSSTAEQRRRRRQLRALRGRDRASHLLESIVDCSIRWLSYQDDDDWVDDVVGGFVDARILCGATEDEALRDTERLAIESGVLAP